MEALPNQTLYVNNLNEKTPKQDLRRSLYSLFSQFGPILDVVALKTTRMRGQAFVAFRDIGSASNALRSLNGFVFYGKPMRITFAKSKSHSVMKEDGTYAKVMAKAKRQKLSGKPEEEKEKVNGNNEDEEEEEEEDAEDQPMADVEGGSDEENKILFVDNLPDNANEKMVKMVFKQFPGLKEVRLIPGRNGIAFVEFASSGQAAVARQTLQGFKVTPQQAIQVSFAKK